MTRFYARGPRGERVISKVPRTRGENFTLICALSLRAVQAELVIEGALNGEVFKTYIKEVLCPSLQKGQTVIMDNLSSHKIKEIRGLIEEVGCSLIYLPPYSPDFNPIEMLFSKLKAYMRGKAERVREKLIETLGGAISRVTVSDIMGWFKHALPNLLH